MHGANWKRADWKRTDWKRAIGGGLLGCVLPMLVGCNFFVPENSNGGNTTSGNNVYVLNGTTQSVAAFTIGTGTLTAISGSPFALGFTPQAAVVSRNDGFLYIAGPGVINTYTIANGGALSQSSCTGCEVVANVASLDVSPDGQWMFGLDLTNSVIDLWQLDTTTGAMTAQVGATYTIPTGSTLSPKQVRVSPAGDMVAASLGTAGDVVFPFTTSTGAFSTTYQTLTTGSTQIGDNSVAFNSAETVLYIARSGTTSGVAAYAIASGGGLTAIAGSPFAAGTTPTWVQVDKTSKYVYVANRGGGTISGYTIGSTGALTAIVGSPFASGTLVGSLGTDSTGVYVLASASGGSPDLTMYSFDTAVAGKLDSATTVATGSDPTGASLVALTH